MMRDYFWRDAPPWRQDFCEDNSAAKQIKEFFEHWVRTPVRYTATVGCAIGSLVVATPVVATTTVHQAAVADADTEFTIDDETLQQTWDSGIAYMRARGRPVEDILARAVENMLRAESRGGDPPLPTHIPDDER